MYCVLCTVYYVLCCEAVQSDRNSSKSQRKWLRLQGSRSYFTTNGQSVCLGVEHPCGTCEQILLLVGMLLAEICGFASVGSPL
jgi:hypothetical protein